ncbi:MAG: hypothetical protein HC921_21975 [Synechococcaceae cyanobacterium SM2_3_1]|nr:hypothetical protein [Synechococcaceae cyanobacterium SM2_3_1]
MTQEAIQRADTRSLLPHLKAIIPIANHGRTQDLSGEIVLTSFLKHQADIVVGRDPRELSIEVATILLLEMEASSIVVGG